MALSQIFVVPDVSGAIVAVVVLAILLVGALLVLPAIRR